MSSQVDDRFTPVLGDIRKRLLSATDYDAILDVVCSSLVEADLYDLVWYGKTDVKEGTLTPVERAGTGVEPSFEGTFSVDGDSATPEIGNRAFRTGDVQIVTDIHEGGTLPGTPEEDPPNANPWHELAAEHGLHSYAVVPAQFGDSGVPYGFLSVYTDRRIARGDREQRFLADVGDALGRALDGLQSSAVLPDDDNQLRLRAVARALPDLMLIYDQNGRYVEVLTPQYIRNFTTPEELVGKYAHDVLPEDIADDIVDAIDAALETGDVQEVEYAIPISGEKVWVSARLAPLDPPDGDQVAFIGRHITERKEYERKLRRRTQQLEILNRIVRHDIRNEMNVIQAEAELLRDGLDEEYEEHLDNLLRSVANTTELTDTTQDFVETIASDDDPELTPVNLGAVVEDQVSKVRARHDDARIEIAGELPPIVVTANEMLSSVFRNLLTNAVQHNDTAAPEVTVSVTRRDGSVVVSVADNGPGIPDRRKQEVFGKGEHGLESAGTGIGLFLVNKLVSEYGGTVWVEDNDPRGSAVKLALPLARKD